MKTFKEFVEIIDEKIKVSGSEIRAYLAGKQENTPAVSSYQLAPADPAKRTHLPYTEPGSKEREKEVQDVIVKHSGAKAIKRAKQQELKRARAEAEAAIRARKKAAKS